MSLTRSARTSTVTRERRHTVAQCLLKTRGLRLRRTARLVPSCLRSSALPRRPLVDGGRLATQRLFFSEGHVNYIFSVLKKEFIQYLFFSGYFLSAEFDPDGSFVAIGVGGIVGSRVLWSFLATSAVSCSCSPCVLCPFLVLGTRQLPRSFWRTFLWTTAQAQARRLTSPLDIGVSC